jgi:agmatine deiminase
MVTPKDLGYYFPAEWHPHAATWLSFPRNTETWENRFERIFPSYFKFIELISKSEKVCINANDISTINFINERLKALEIDGSNIELFEFATNDSWCRDHGPGFLINKKDNSRLIVDWEYNAWGGKYPPFEADNAIPKQIANQLKIPFVSPEIVLEGGSVEFNGAGTILTSESCLLNKNRNPHLSKSDIETFLCNFYGAEQILWVKDGIVGDDTDGHIDDTVRFVNEDTVITMIEKNKNDDNHLILMENLNQLKKMRLINQKSLNIIEIDMPLPVYDSKERLPASYANFYITNKHVIVPTYQCDNDEKALEILQSCFKDRIVVGVNSTEIIWGLGSFHCLSQQEPLANNIF